MMPVGPLMIEHRLIERMLSLIDQHVKVAASSSPAAIDLSLIEKGWILLRIAVIMGRGRYTICRLESKPLNADKCW